MAQKQVIILMGPPGSGKGTQGELIAEKMGLYYFETSKILEQSFQGHREGEFVEVEGKKYFLKEEEEIWKKGILCSPPFVSHLVKEKVKDLHQKGESLLLSGSPRTLLEGQELMPLLEKLYGKDNIKIILLNISAEQTISRNSHRRICELMRHPVLYTPETEKLTRCPLDGSKLVRREGLDDPETILKRLEEYKERTIPLLEFYKENGLEVKEVDGEGSVAEVFERVLNALQ